MNITHYFCSGSKPSPTVAPKARRQKSSSNSSDVFDDKDGSGLFGGSQDVAASPSRKKASCVCTALDNNISGVYNEGEGVELLKK